MPSAPPDVSAQPLVSCLMVTANRAHLARRAIECLERQTWKHHELVIIDDGTEDYIPLIEDFRDRLCIRYHHVARRDDLLLGGLRNLALDHATGDYCIQWDDDEWYHPERIAAQMHALQTRKLDAVLLRFALMHLDEPGMSDHPYRVDGIDGIPGTILHRRTTERYPNQRRSEDTRFMEALQKRSRVGAMSDGSHLFIRCFHGQNTWDRQHFFGKLRRTWIRSIQYFLAKYLQGDVLRHPAFKLTPLEQAAVRDFLAHSRALHLVRSDTT